MNTDTVSVRLARSTKARLQQLAKSTGRSRAFLAAQAIEEYLDINGAGRRHSRRHRLA
jgi:RHH-type rel operon transcriptional repressor/antitoxin RelB